MSGPFRPARDDRWGLFWEPHGRERPIHGPPASCWRIRRLSPAVLTEDVMGKQNACGFFIRSAIMTVEKTLNFPVDVADRAPYVSIFRS